MCPFHSWGRDVSQTVASGAEGQARRSWLVPVVAVLGCCKALCAALTALCAGWANGPFVPHSAPWTMSISLPGGEGTYPASYVLLSDYGAVSFSYISYISYVNGTFETAPPPPPPGRPPGVLT